MQSRKTTEIKIRPESEYNRCLSIVKENLEFK